MQEFRFYVKDNHQKISRVVFLFLLFFHVVVVGLLILSSLKNHSFNKLLIVVGISAIVIIIFYFFQRKRKTCIVISKELIVIEKIFTFKKYNWNEIENMILKDGLLTIDLKSNKLIQVKIISTVNEDIFNAFALKTMVKP